MLRFLYEASHTQCEIVQAARGVCLSSVAVRHALDVEVSVGLVNLFRHRRGRVVCEYSLSRQARALLEIPMARWSENSMGAGAAGFAGQTTSRVALRSD